MTISKYEDQFDNDLICPDCDAIFEKNEDGGYIEQ